jgi:anti-sigma factor (TIGR02949 family)
MDCGPDRLVSCQTFERQLYHFQAGELPDADRAALAAHAADCVECGHRLAIEDAFLGALKARLQRTSAPPDLRDRVRAALRAEGPRGRTPVWRRPPWLVPLLASGLLAAGLVAISGSVGSPPGSLPVDRDVLVVDLECDRAGAALDDQRACDEPQHLNALKVGNERYWNVSMDQDGFRHLVIDPAWRGHRLRVRGDLFTRIRTVRLTDFEDLGRAAAPAAGGDAFMLRYERNSNASHETRRGVADGSHLRGG